MSIEGGTAIVLAYVLVSMGVIIAFLLAAFVVGLMGPRIQRWDPWLVVEQTTLLRRGTLHERIFSH